MNMFARFDEIPAMTDLILQDIKEDIKETTDRRMHGQTDAQTT